MKKENNGLIKTASLISVLIVMFFIVFFSLSGSVLADKCDITFVKEIKEPEEEKSELGWNPVDVAVDSNGGIIVADVTNDRILIFDKDGNFIKSFIPSNYGIKELKAFGVRLSGIAVDSQDRIIVVDGLYDRIQILDKDGNFIKSIGSDPIGEYGKGEGEFSQPSEVVTDSKDRIIIADNLNHRVQIFDRDGNFIKAFGRDGRGKGEFGSLSDVAVDSQDRIIVVDSGNDRIQMFDRDGNFIKAIGTKEFVEYPSNVGVDSQDRIIVNGGNYTAYKNKPSRFDYKVLIFDSAGDTIKVVDNEKNVLEYIRSGAFVIDSQGILIIATSSELNILNLNCTTELKINILLEIVNGENFNVKITFSKSPIENAKVQYANKTKMTDSNGEVQFTAEKGTYIIKAMKEGYEPVSIPVTSKEKSIPYYYFLPIIIVLLILIIFFVKKYIHSV